MNTKLLIIIGIVLASVIFTALGTVMYIQNQCESLPGYWHMPRPTTLENCLQYLQQNDNSKQSQLDDDHLRKLHCVQTFEKIYLEFLDRPSCERSPPEPTCEPELFETVIRENKEFLESSCVYDFEDWAYFSEYNDIIWRSLTPQYSFDVPKVNPASKPVPLVVEEWGYHMCDDFNVMIISHDEKRDIVWHDRKSNFCVVVDPQKWQKFTHEMSVTSNPILLEHGNYYALLYFGKMLEIDNLIDDSYEEFDEVSKIYFSVNANMDLENEN